MFNQIKLLFIAFVFLNSLEAHTQSFVIKGKVQQISSYCGGARPTQEILYEMAKPQPFANKTFYIRKGKTNNTRLRIISKFTTDSNGNFSFKLPQGIYSILVVEQAKEIHAKDYINSFQTVDNKCLQTWWKKPYYLLVVEKQNKFLNFSFQHRCYINNDIPCITYIGPRHP